MTWHSARVAAASDGTRRNKSTTASRLSSQSVGSNQQPGCTRNRVGCYVASVRASAELSFSHAALFAASTASSDQVVLKYR